jgi:signal transduction histidine kinase
MGIGRFLPRSPLDAALALVGVMLCEIAVWVHPNPIADGVAGDQWLLFVFPLLLGVPLAWRRHSPLAAFAVIMGGVTLQAVATGDSSEGLHNMFCAGVGIYAVAAYSVRGRAAVGLAIGMVGYAAYALNNHDIQGGSEANLWAGAFFGVALLTIWLGGVFMRNRRQERLVADTTRALQRAAREAVSDERARLARELHDVISHNLSVMVVQAAGARAAGGSNPTALENIENSGRQSLVEMRRLLGVLRQDSDNPSLAPQPGIASIEELIAQVRAAGVTVDLSVEGDVGQVLPAVDLSVYRIVQESLTNVIKHAGPASVSVRLQSTRDSITIEVADDGRGSDAAAGLGHGLIGMKERVAMFGGDFLAGPARSGGFRVHARLPLDSGPT